MPRPSYDPDFLLVGIIGRPHGLDGEMTLRSYNGHGTDLAQVTELVLETEGAPVKRRVRSARPATEGWLLRLEGIDSREGAAALTHVAVRVQKALLPPLGPGEFFVEDLLGCVVHTEKGDILGVVETVFWNGAHDVMSISPPTEPGGGEETLIPVVPHFVRTFDAPGRRVVVFWEGHD